MKNFRLVGPAWLSLALLLSPPSLLAANGPGAAPDQVPSGMVPGHHVRLTGDSFNEEIARRFLLGFHSTCKLLRKSNGEAWVELPSGLPVIRPIYQVDIYYASNRAMTVLHGQSYELNRDCSLKKRPQHRGTLTSRVGACDVDFLEHKRRGVCDAASHAAAPPHSPSPALRSLVRAPELKTVAGQTCRTYRLEAPLIEHCVAELTAAEGQVFSPAAAPPSTFNGGLGGVLLELNSPDVMTLKARAVNYNIVLPASVFSPEFSGGAAP